jgi:hypothetical protein
MTAADVPVSSATEDTWSVKPLALWTGILAGPIAWACDLLASYALVKWICTSQRLSALHLISLLALVVVGIGALVAWRTLRLASRPLSHEGALSRQRARFMATLGLASSALFALTIVAGAIPPFMIDACQ